MLRFAGRALLCAAPAVPSSSPSVEKLAQAAQDKLDGLSPRAIADILDKYIVGQQDGKRAVAISLRNRWRRRQLSNADLQREVVPKNMLLIGPTGVGKTEISRRMARITDAPFVKVEATKYTEVGFKGKDVESIIEDLYATAKSKAKRLLGEERRAEAHGMAVDYVFSSWRSQASLRRMQEDVDEPDADSADDDKDGDDKKAGGDATAAEGETKAGGDAAARKSPQDITLEYFAEHYKDELKDELVTISVTVPDAAPKSNMLGDLLMTLSGGGGAPKQRMVKKRVEEAVALSTQEWLDRLISDGAVAALAKTLAEDDGVVFIDEIDKVVAEPNSASADVSSTGVQQDLLPLVEGSNVTLKDGTTIATDNILFICSGAFHTAKTSDMIAELQGRLPVRVELKPLTEKDFRKILTEPAYNLLRQQREMLKTENIDVVFAEDGIDELARVTTVINAQGQNIGARRLHTVLERVMDPYSFDCEDYEGKTVTIDAAAVRKATEKLQKNVDLAKYLL